jgi:hypothetical protein
MLWIWTPLIDPDSSTYTIMIAVDEILIFVFTSEAFLKIVSVGFLINGKRSYLRDYWNVLDFIVVITSIVPYFLDQQGKMNTAVKIFLILRFIRPLKILGKSEGLKISVVSLLKSVKGITQITQMSVLFITILAIISINYMKGTFYYCMTDSIDLK